MRFTIHDLKKSKVAGINTHVLDQGTGKKVGGNKFGAKRVVLDGIDFDSTKEAGRYMELKMLQRAKLIKDLKLQQVYLLIEKSETERKCEYKADFVYTLVETGETVVEDVKSSATRKLSTYIMKRKLMLSIHGIKIKEV